MREAKVFALFDPNPLCSKKSKHRSLYKERVTLSLGDKIRFLCIQLTKNRTFVKNGKFSTKYYVYFYRSPVSPWTRNKGATVNEVHFHSFIDANDKESHRV